MILAICPGKNGDVEDLIIKSKGKAFNMSLAPIPSSGLSRLFTGSYGAPRGGIFDRQSTQPPAQR